MVECSTSAHTEGVWFVTFWKNFEVVLYVYLSLEDGETINDSFARASRVFLQESRALVQELRVLL